MNNQNRPLPDALRPTELHDFSDFFNSPRKRAKKTGFALIAVVALLFVGYEIMHGTTEHQDAIEIVAVSAQN